MATKNKNDTAVAKDKYSQNILSREHGVGGHFLASKDIGGFIYLFI